VQIEALKSQIEVALKHDLPIIFHVREAFDDFWPIFDNYKGIRGVLHSFTDSKENMEKAIAKGLYIGVNGISTFTKDDAQKTMFDAIPLDRILFETDAPFLTPTPYRGKINQPAYVKVVAEYHAQRRGISFEEIANASTHNARALFQLTVQS
jgi:TatD DNase family protein